MKVAQALRQKNIIEYILYMWQVEDLLRAAHCDVDEVRERLLSRFPEEERPSLEAWYANLVEMMRMEGVTEKGHLQILRNLVADLAELHATLLASTRYPYYHAAYFKALPYIVELRQKNGDLQKSELETCLDLMYGVWMLRLQQKPLSEGTQEALQAVSSFLSMLAGYYNNKEEIDHE